MILEQKLLENKDKLPKEKYFKTDENELNKLIPENENKTKNDETEFTYIRKANECYESIIHKNLQNFHFQFQILYDNMIEIFSQSNIEKMKWISMENNYKHEIENLSSLLESMKIRINEVEKLKISFMPSENIDAKITVPREESILENETKINSEQISIVQENMDKEFPNINDILYDLEKVAPEKVAKVRLLVELYLRTVEKKKYFERKNEYIELILKNFQTEKEEIINDFNDYKLKTLKSNKLYEVKIQRLLFEFAELRNELKKSVPLSEFVKQNEKLNNISMKYRKYLNELHYDNFEIGPVVHHTSEEKDIQEQLTQSIHHGIYTKSFSLLIKKYIENC